MYNTHNTHAYNIMVYIYVCVWRDNALFKEHYIYIYKTPAKIYHRRRSLFLGHLEAPPPHFAAASIRFSAAATLA